MHTTLAHVFKRLALILMGLLMALLCLELLLRLFPQPNIISLNRQLFSIWESDDELLLRPRAQQKTAITAHPEFRFSVETNSAGWRDSDAPEGPFEIAIIGDSMTFGYGVEGHEAYPEVLQARSGWRVANLGWQGWNSHVYPAALERYALPSQAKVWIWAFFCNDLRESSSVESLLLEQKSQNGLGFKERSSQDLRQGFPYNSALFLTGTTYLLPGRGFLDPSANKWFQGDGLSMMISDYPWQIAEPDDPDVIRGWELTAQALERASRLATEQGAILAVIFLPSREQVYGPWIASQLPPGRTLAALASVENRLAALASAYNLPYFSLLAGLQEFARPNKLLYFAGDAHFNVAGNQAAAEVLFAWLQQQNWLPPAPSSP